MKKLVSEMGQLEMRIFTFSIFRARLNHEMGYQEIKEC